MLPYMVHYRYMHTIGLLFDMSPLLCLITQVTVCAIVLLVILVCAVWEWDYSAPNIRVRVRFWVRVRLGLGSGLEVKFGTNDSLRTVNIRRQNGRGKKYHTRAALMIAL